MSGNDSCHYAPYLACLEVAAMCPPQDGHHPSTTATNADADAGPANTSVMAPAHQEPRLDAGNKHQDHCACKIRPRDTDRR